MSIWRQRITSVMPTAATSTGALLTTRSRRAARRRKNRAAATARTSRSSSVGRGDRRARAGSGRSCIATAASAACRRAPAPGSPPASPRRGRASPTTVPPCITAIRSLMPRISGSSDEIIRIASPCAASSPISRWISAFAPTSTPCVGSSRMRTAGSAASQRARATFCWLPPERLPTGASIDGRLDRRAARTNVGGQLALAARSRAARTRETARERSPAWCWRRPTSRGSRRAAGGPRGRRRCPQRDAPAPGESIATRLGRAAGSRPRRRASGRRGRAPARSGPRRRGRPGRGSRPRGRSRLTSLHARRPAAEPAHLQDHVADRRPPPWGRPPTARGRPSSGSARPGSPRPSAACRRARRRAGPSRGRRSAGSSSSRCEM